MAKHTFNKILVSILLITAQIYVMGETLPDPTRPSTFTIRRQIQQELPQEYISWNVKAIKTSAEEKNAIVNDQLVKIGDEINSARVVDITSNTVVLEHDRKELVLRLLPKDLKVKRDTPLTTDTQ